MSLFHKKKSRAWLLVTPHFNIFTSTDLLFMQKERKKFQQANSMWICVRSLVSNVFLLNYYQRMLFKCSNVKCCKTFFLKRERERGAIFFPTTIKIYFWSTFCTLEYKLHTSYVNDQGKVERPLADRRFILILHKICSHSTRPVNWLTSQSSLPSASSSGYQKSMDQWPLSLRHTRV